MISMAIASPIKNPTSSFILPHQTCQHLTLAQIEPATRGFDESLVIGRGGFGIVYKSLTNFGLANEVAIKRLNSTSTQGVHEFEAEVKLLSTLRHGNLVPLIGYCSEAKERILAYEFMPNGTLDDHLHRGATRLSWLQRLKICVGAARGLNYLHTGTSTQHGVIHRDVKTSNILLDSNFEARISDFGLAKVGAISETKTHVSSTLVKGTHGYMDPCYYYSGKPTRKTDVYAFGVVLFEVLSGKKAVDSTLDEDQWSLAVWAQEHAKEGRLAKIVCPTLIGQISKKCLKEFTSIALKCLHSQPKQRPTMAEIMVKLESILSREREIAGPGVDDGRFMSKVRYFFTGKTDLIPAHIKGNESEIRKLLKATKNYNEAKLCISSLDTIYKGWVEKTTTGPLKSGVYVRTRSIRTSELLFKPEEYNHPNLVKLLGYCLVSGQLSCVYEQHPGTSLDKLLYGDDTGSLSWVARLKIAQGAANGLCFVHKKGLPACDQLQTTCILVDMDYNARLRDFTDWHDYDLVRLDGIYGENTWINDIRMKMDIFYFGVILLEILTGMKVFDRTRGEGKQNLVKWATPLLPQMAKMGMIVDPKLLDNYNNPPKGASMFAKLVSKCLQPTANERPSEEEIIHVLSRCKDITKPDNIKAKQH